MNLLLASILALGVGPVLHRLSRSRTALLSLLDGFNFVAISGLIFLGVLPDALVHGGAWILLFVIAGMLGPTFLERYFHGAGERTHTLALVLGMSGLCLHAIFDGAALVEGASGETEGHFHAVGNLPLAVVLHRIPIGLTIWLLVRPRYGLPMGEMVLGLVTVSTVLGYYTGSWVTANLSGQGTAFFQALVAGTLMHVVVHRVHDERGRAPAPARSVQQNWFAGAGGLVGLGLLAFLLVEDALLPEVPFSDRIVDTFVRLTLESAPALALGYVMAGLMNSLLPVSSIKWMRRGRPWNQSLRGMAIGLPLPVCSCGVVPLYRTLVQRGAPATAAMAFLVATPELGIDAVLLSIPLLGTGMTILRVAAAAIVALLVGWIVGSVVAATGATREPDADPEAPDRGESLVRKLLRGLGVGLGEVVDHTAPWILLGLGVAAVAEPLLEGDWLLSVPPGLKVVLFALLGVPAYVCAAGATPLVAVLLLRGVSPGAALAFLLTGPATNVTTFGILGKLHGRRVAVAFSLSIILLSVAVGFLVNALFPEVRGVAGTSPAEEAITPVQEVSILLLAGICLLSFLRRGPRRFAGEIFLTGSEESEEERGHGGHSHAAHDHATAPLS